MERGLDQQGRWRNKVDVYKRQSHYEPVPKNIADQIIAGRTKG